MSRVCNLSVSLFVIALFACIPVWSEPAPQANGEALSPATVESPVANLSSDAESEQDVGSELAAALGLSPWIEVACYIEECFCENGQSVCYWNCGGWVVKEIGWESC